MVDSARSRDLAISPTDSPLLKSSRVIAAVPPRLLEASIAFEPAIDHGEDGKLVVARVGDRVAGSEGFPVGLEILAGGERVARFMQAEGGAQEKLRLVGSLQAEQTCHFNVDTRTRDAFFPKAMFGNGLAECDAALQAFEIGRAHV